MTFVDSVVGIYVEILHNFTQAIAADSVNCFDEACDVTPFLIVSMKCFFFRWRGEHGAPLSAFTISSNTFCSLQRENAKICFKIAVKSNVQKMFSTTIMKKIRRMCCYLYKTNRKFIVIIISRSIKLIKLVVLFLATNDCMSTISTRYNFEWNTWMCKCEQKSDSW